MTFRNFTFRPSPSLHVFYYTDILKDFAFRISWSFSERNRVACTEASFQAKLVTPLTLCLTSNEAPWYLNQDKPSLKHHQAWNAKSMGTRDWYIRGWRELNLVGVVARWFPGEFDFEKDPFKQKLDFHSQKLWIHKKVASIFWYDLKTPHLR